MPTNAARLADFGSGIGNDGADVSYTHLRANDTSLHIVLRVMLEKK